MQAYLVTRWEANDFVEARIIRTSEKLGGVASAEYLWVAEYSSGFTPNSSLGPGGKLALEIACKGERGLRVSVISEIDVPDLLIKGLLTLPSCLRHGEQREAAS